MNLKVLSLFSGCGGLDLGVEGGFLVHKECIHATSDTPWICLPKKRFYVIFPNDIMAQSNVVWSSNFTGTFQLKSIADLLNENFQFPKANLVIGGFPCQDFSVAGKREGLKTQRGSLYHCMTEVIQQVSPEAFIAENVYGLFYIPGVREKITSDFEQIGYTVFSFLLFSNEYGVPQIRRRVFFIGLKTEALKRKVSINEIIPPKTHQKFVSVGTIFKDLQEPEYTLDKEQQIYSKSKFYGSQWEGNREVDLSLPSPTLRASGPEFRRLSKEHGGKHLDELKDGKIERRLTVREYARIQTFPDDFILMFNKNNEEIISMTSAYRLIGNAVPPLLAYHVSKRLDELWFDIF